MELVKSLKKLESALKTAAEKNIDIRQPADKDKDMFNFNEKRREYYQNCVISALEQVKQKSAEATSLMCVCPANHAAVTRILELLPELESGDVHVLLETTCSMLHTAEKLKYPAESKLLVKAPINSLPEEIRADVVADISELNKCFASECFRSCVIICGRLLETALHRKYFEVTGLDALEKNPGIGLGTLVAKLSEKNIKLDPAITQQIHLINQVRIFSVHKKQDAFYPTRMQAQAIVFYTMDILEKMFYSKTKNTG